MPISPMEAEKLAKENYEKWIKETYSEYTEVIDKLLVMRRTHYPPAFEYSSDPANSFDAWQIFLALREHVGLRNKIIQAYEKLGWNVIFHNPKGNCDSPAGLSFSYDESW